MDRSNSSYKRKLLILPHKKITSVHNRDQTPFERGMIVHRLSPVRKAITPETPNKPKLNFNPILVNTRTSLKSRMIPRRKIEKVDVKEAMRDFEWLSKAHSQLSSDFLEVLRKSNGMSIQSSERLTYFKYYLGPGNNHPLVKRVLDSRWWWTKSEDIDSAHFVWTQWIDEEFINSLPEVSPADHISEINFKRDVECSRKFLPKHAVMPKVVDISALGYDMITSSNWFVPLKQIPSENFRIYSKIDGNFQLSDKKQLFYNLKEYCQKENKDLFSIIPLTFHANSLRDQKFQEFQRFYYESKYRYWIVKPGEDSNRGNGISVCTTIDEIKSKFTREHTYIIQKYIENPLLIHKRKFDIRCFTLVTCFNGVIQAYFYSEGYIRTSSEEFSLHSSSKYIHLTNDAIQKWAKTYGKFENANKMAYSDLQKYLDRKHPGVSFCKHVLPQIKEIVCDTIRATHNKFNKKLNTFEIFGYDFMVDSSFKPWLIEVNTNPCLELSSPQLTRIIPAMLENSLKIALDPLFNEPTIQKKRSKSIPFNKYQLIFHSEFAN